MWAHPSILSLYILSRLFYHDYYTDPLGWDNDDITTTTGASPTNKRCLRELTVQSCVRDVEGVRGVEGVIVFDCLSLLLLQQSAPSVSRLLHGLGKRAGQSSWQYYYCLSVGNHCLLVLSLVHSDLHEDHVISQLTHVTSTVVSMQAPPPLTDNLCSVYHRRKSGKVSKQVIHYSFAQVLFIGH